MSMLLQRAGLVWPARAPERWALAHYLSYRVGIYLVLNVVEDPAWLAWAFC